MTNPICTDTVCDTTVPVVTPPITSVPTPTCGLPTNQVYTNATIHTNASGCISHIESGDPFLYTPDPCCPASGGGTGGGGSSLDGPQGDPGAAGTIAIGTVTTGAPGSAASVINVGTNNAAILNITIPAGEAGLDGATPSGLDHNVDGLIITDGLVQQLPSWWPPIHTVSPPSLTNNGIAMTFVKNTDGSLTITLDAAGLVATFNAQQVIQDSNINALTNTVALLQTNLSTLQTAHDDLKARVDAAGIP
jgi:hypothetical protein